MVKKFFNSLFKNLDNSDYNSQQPAGDSTVDAQHIDFIAKQHSIIDAILANIHGMVVQFGIKPQDYALDVYINELMLYQSCLDERFKDALVERLKMDCNYIFVDVIVKEGTPQKNFASRQVTDKASICLINNRKAVSRQAKLTAMEGSLVTDGMVLDSNEIEKLPGKRMNMGIGKSMKLHSGVVRINHIAIDDNSEGKFFDSNKYVSRAHAHVTYNSKEGFILTVEVGGTPIGHHRTMVYRNNREIRMDVPGMSVPLENGDQIILSRKVTLYFETLNND